MKLVYVKLQELIEGNTFRDLGIEPFKLDTNSVDHDEILNQINWLLDDMWNVETNTNRKKRKAVGVISVDQYINPMPDHLDDDYNDWNPDFDL